MSATADTTRPLLSVRDLVKHFVLKGAAPKGGQRPRVRAVDGISFDVMSGETLGVVGESGCGKSTLVRVVMQLIGQDAGSLAFEGQTVGSRELPLRRYRRHAQMVFQDSYASLNPRLTIERSVSFGPSVHGMSAKEATGNARRLLGQVGLDPARFANRYPHELSGGQRQRVNIARALALEPRLVILDEAVSALDKSVEAQVLNLLMDLKEQYGLTYLFISHDLNVVRYLCDRVLVMYLGQVVELAEVTQLFTDPRHPYTRALLKSMPTSDPDQRTEVAPLSGDTPSPIDPPSGCRFHTRCPNAQAVCAQKEPPLTIENGRAVRCLMYVADSGYPVKLTTPPGHSSRDVS